MHTYSIYYYGFSIYALSIKCRLQMIFKQYLPCDGWFRLSVYLDLEFSLATLHGLDGIYLRFDNR